jgi:translation initiation factor IF-3
LGVVPTPRALALAQSEGWDLVEIAPNATPPVAKILDFGKYRYEEQQKAKDAKKKQKAVTWKEIRMAPKIDDHDIETKIKAAQRFLDEGDKLKVTVRFRGREMAHPDRGRALLLAVGDKLKEHGVIERMPLLEGRQMIMVMNPVRAVQVQNAPGGGPMPVAGVGTPVPASPSPANSPSPQGARPAPVVPAVQRPAQATPAPTPSPAKAPATPPASVVRPEPAAPKVSTPATTPPAAPAPRTAPTRPATGNRVH